MALKLTGGKSPGDKSQEQSESEPHQESDAFQIELDKYVTEMPPEVRTPSEIMAMSIEELRGYYHNVQTWACTFAGQEEGTRKQLTERNAENQGLRKQIEQLEIQLRDKDGAPVLVGDYTAQVAEIQKNSDRRMWKAVGLTALASLLIGSGVAFGFYKIGEKNGKASAPDNSARVEMLLNDNKELRSNYEASQKLIKEQDDTISQTRQNLEKITGEVSSLRVDSQELTKLQKRVGDLENTLTNTQVERDLSVQARKSMAEELVTAQAKYSEAQQGYTDAVNQLKEANDRFDELTAELEKYKEMTKPASRETVEAYKGHARDAEKMAKEGINAAKEAREGAKGKVTLPEPYPAPGVPRPEANNDDSAEEQELPKYHPELRTIYTWKNVEGDKK